jgi:putative oxidoreductase
MNNLIAAYSRLTPNVYRSWYAIPIRIIVGYGFMEHGYAKIMHGPESFTTILHALGVPAPGLLAWATILVELFGGLAVFLGAFIPIVSIPMAIVLFVAIFTVHLPNGFSSIKLLSVDAAGAHFGQPGYETDLLYLAGLLALVLGGSGPLAFDNLFLRRSSKAMKTKSVLGGCIMALLAVASVAAYAQMMTTEITYAQNAGVVDAEGNLRVPVDYRTTYQFLGSWGQRSNARVQRRCMSFTRRRARLRPTAKMDGSRTARC